MGTIDKLAAELTAERQKLALYEKNLRVAVESCKALKAEKENLANIVAGFACAEIKAGSSEVEQLKQKIGLLTKEFQSKENAYILARSTVLKENTELRKKVVEVETILKNAADTSGSGFQIAELEQKLRREVALNRKYEKRLQQAEESLKNSTTSDGKLEQQVKRLEEEREQFKKLYEDAHGKCIYLERKFASLQLDQRKIAEESSKPLALNEIPEDDFRISNLENQIINLSKQCDEKEDEISELSTLITTLKGENICLKERLEQSERCKSTTPLAENSFADVMIEEYEKFKLERGEILDFCCPALKNDIISLIEDAQVDNSQHDKMSQLQTQISELKRKVASLTAKINENDRLNLENEKKIKELENVLLKKDESVAYQKDELKRVVGNLREEKFKRDELEEEMSKQRARAQDEIDARDREIEVFRKMLVSFRHENLEKSSSARKISKHNRSSTHEDEMPGGRRSRTFSQEDANVPNDPDSKNVYYENQLTKKDCDIQDLRKQLMDLEVRLRENESVAMSRQLESVARAEEMIEKVRALEGKLQILSSTNEIDYLRNIFSQFLNSMSSQNIASKPILKAIGSVLKVPLAEMKLIDKK